MNLTAKDIAWIDTALDGFISVGNPEFSNSLEQRNINERVALRCKEKLANRSFSFIRDECRIIYVSLSLLHGELAEHPDSDPETPEVLELLTRLINAFAV